MPLFLRSRDFVKATMMIMTNWLLLEVGITNSREGRRYKTKKTELLFLIDCCEWFVFICLSVLVGLRRGPDFVVAEEVLLFVGAMFHGFVH